MTNLNSPMMILYRVLMYKVLSLMLMIVNRTCVLYESDTPIINENEHSLRVVYTYTI